MRIGAGTTDAAGSKGGNARHQSVVPDGKAVRAACRQGATAPIAKRRPPAYSGQGIFQLRPDLLIETADTSWVLDTKWKRINGADRDNKYGLNQGDFYQMLAYGLQYLNGQGDMVLIYPRSPEFANPLPLFKYSDELRLHVWPFDLENDELMASGDTMLPLKKSDPKQAAT